ncbi:MAG: efflux transporter outer membrane subunit [Betaproteobacteria bacterium]
MRKLTLTMLFAAALAGCTTTPIAPPPLDLPKTGAYDPALERWWTAFNDPVLTALIDEALAQNLDLAAAITRVDQARAQYKIVQFAQYPDVNVGANAARSRQSTVGNIVLPPGTPAIANDFRVGLNASYELDLWGKYRTATAAAQNDLLATQYARETVRTVVAAEVARAYFRLLASDAQLSVLNDTLRIRTETVSLQQDRFDAGVIGEFDLATAQAERAAVASDVAVAVRLVSENQSALAVLLGRSPREVFEPKFDRDLRMVWLVTVPTLPPELPSDMLSRRPDIRDAELRLAAANQRIDVARADYFPSISLTGAFGSESGVLKSLFSGPAMIWSIGAGLIQPLVGLALVTDNVELKTAQRDETVVFYRQTVQAAFRDAHDALTANQTTRDALAAQTERKDFLQKSLELADLRYRAGYSAYIEVLDVQRQLLQAQSLQIVAARNVRLAVVDVAKALGGGWDYKTAVAGP